MWSRKKVVDIVDGSGSDGGNSDTVFVALITLASVCIAVVMFNFTLDRYTTHFGTPGDLAKRAAAEAASSAASGTPSTAIADARAAWGQFGDYLGGMLNPVLSFFSFIALSMALMLQARQVSLSRMELREARSERAEAQLDAKAQVKATRTLAAAQIRTARAQERAAQLLARQLEETSAAARAQEQTALALMRQAKVGTLSSQLALAREAATERLKMFSSAQEQFSVDQEANRPALEDAILQFEAAAAHVERLQAAIAAVEA